MRKNLFLLILACSVIHVNTNLAQDINSIVKDFVNSKEASHAMVGFSLLDNTGDVLIAENAEKSMSPASTQKLLTSITALDILGYDHKFTTTLSIMGTVVDGKLIGNVVIKSGGDPVLGSEDFKGHYGEFINDWINAISKEGITQIEGRVLVDDRVFKGDRNAGSSAINDIGNYYGAGAPGFSFMDNEFRVYFDTKSVGLKSTINRVEPELPKEVEFINDVKASTKSGDNVIIYSLDGSDQIFLKGELPANQKEFEVRGSIPDVSAFTASYFTGKLIEAGIDVTGEEKKGPLFINSKELVRTKSPALIEILKVLNKKSVNTYADVLLKHIGIFTNNEGSFEAGAKGMIDHWKDRGINVDGLNIEDGSGLSRKNNVTASFMTTILSSVSSDEHVAKLLTEASESNSVRSMWGNGIKGAIIAKSGYIGRVRAYSGYLLKEDQKYPFHIMVNNYHGSPSEMRGQIGKLLNSIYGKL